MGTAAEARIRTPKGQREAERLLDAATEVLARDGFGGATLGRIATAAGVDKKMIVYYFSGRDALLAAVVGRVGARVAQNVAAAVDGVSGPGAVAEIAIDKLWEGTVAEPELTRAYLALATNHRESDRVALALGALKASFVELFSDWLLELETQGFRLQEDRDGYLKLVVAMWRGLAMDWAEDGESPALEEALRQFKRAAMAPFEPVST